MPYYNQAAGQTEYVMLACTEMPEVRFNDIVRYTLRNPAERGRRILIAIDPEFVQVCEPDTLEVISIATSQPGRAGAAVRDDYVALLVDSDVPLPFTVTIVISGIRKGLPGRFTRATREQMERNERFWNSTWRGDDPV